MIFQRILVSVVVVIVLIVGCQKRETQSSTGGGRHVALVQAEPRTLATIPVEDLPDNSSASGRHAPGESLDNQMVIEFNRYGNGVTYIARVAGGVHVVYNGHAGKKYQEIDSSTLTHSDDGSRLAYGALNGGKWYIVADGREYGPYDEIGPPAFSPDAKHIAFESKQGGAWRMHCDETTSSTVESYFEKPVFSGNSERLLLMVNKAGGIRLIISDLKFRTLAEHTFGPLTYRVDPAGQRIIVMTRDTAGKRRVIEISFDHPEEVRESAAYDDILNVAFSSDGRGLAYIAKKGGTNYMILDGREEPLPDGAYPSSLVVRPGNRGVGVVIAAKEGTYLHHALDGDRVLEGRYKECADLTYSKDGKLHAYLAIKNEKFLIVANGNEGPSFDRVIGPQFSPDGKYLVYRARQEGRRFVVVADTNGKILRRHPAYERVFETAFTPDGKSVAYGVKDGQQLLWKVERLP